VPVYRRDEYSSNARGKQSMKFSYYDFKKAVMICEKCKKAYRAYKLKTVNVVIKR
jgi:hypothetical protein